MYQQFKALKAEHPSALLLYRLGDFYELFEEDAEIGSRELGLTLTKRRFSKSISRPMAGFPHRYINSYVSRLIKKGYMVAVADQLEDARQAKGLVKRGVVRVVTSGTVMDDSMLTDHRDNFLLALSGQAEKSPIGLAFLDLSTGDFQCAALPWPDLNEELTRIRPSEVILPPALHQNEAFTTQLKADGVARLSPLSADCFASEPAFARLKAHFGVQDLSAYSNDPPALIAASVILHYLQSNQASDLAHITSLNQYHLPDFLTLDSITRRNLELSRTIRERKYEGSLLHNLDHSQTRMGTRLLRRWIEHPLADQDRIQARLDAVEHLVNESFFRQDLRTALKGLYDLERIAGRIGYGNVNARDLINLKSSLQRVPQIKTLLDEYSGPNDGLLARLNHRLDPLSHLASLIQHALVDEPPILITEGGLIKDGYSPDLDGLRQSAQAGRRWLTDYENEERERTGIKNLRIKYNSVFGFFIEVTKSNLSRVPKEYQRRATISSGERFSTNALKAHENDILTAEDAAFSLEYQLFLDLRKRVSAELGILRQTAHVLAQLDVMAALAHIAATRNYCKPILSHDNNLSLREARHPIVEQAVPDDSPFVPNDCHLSDEERLIVLTGPNMSGKSVYLRQVALCVLLAQMGSFVPASEAHIGLADRIFARAGASDDISQGRSTFLVEMSETAHILHHASAQSLIILDEVGRGTSTFDGLSLAWAVAEDIHRTLQARCLFATHFHELTDLEKALPAIGNYSLAVHENEGQVIFLRKLIQGGADQSYGIHVARLAGLPARVLEQAQSILDNLEKRHTSPLQPRPQSVIAESAVSYETKPPESPPAASNQTQADHPILQELGQVDIANLTPLEALLKLNAWQQQIKGRGERGQGID